MTALSEAVKAKLGITEPLPQPALLSPSPGLSTLADDLKRSRVSRLLPKVTCPSPFHPRARTVPIAELQDVPVMETEKRGLSALAPLAGVSLSPSGLTPGGGKMGRPIAQANIQLKLVEFDPKNLPEWADEFAEFLLLTGRSHVDVATKCSLLFARRHILSPLKTVRSNLHCKTTLQQKPVGRVTRWMPLTPLGQCKFGCSAPQDPVGRPPAHEGVIYAIYHQSWMCIRDCKQNLANRGYFRRWSGWIS